MCLDILVQENKRGKIEVSLNGASAFRHAEAGSPQWGLPATTVRGRGLEPLRPKAQDPKSCASANSATLACSQHPMLRDLLNVPFA